MKNITKSLVLALLIVMTSTIVQPEATMSRKVSGELPLLLTRTTDSRAIPAASDANSANQEGMSGFGEHPFITGSALMVKAFEGIVTVTSSMPERINSTVVKN